MHLKIQLRAIKIRLNEKVNATATKNLQSSFIKSEEK